MDETEFDFCIVLNMLSGMSYEEARAEAKVWFKEAREANSEDNQ